MEFIKSAFAQTAAPAGEAAAAQGSLLGGVVPLLLMLVVFYFLLIRPQQKKFKEHQSMLSAIRRGDKVITGGGIVGTVYKVEDGDDMLTVEIAPDVRVKVTRPSITGVLSKTGNAESKTEEKSDAKLEVVSDNSAKAPQKKASTSKTATSKSTSSKTQAKK